MKALEEKIRQYHHIWKGLTDFEKRDWQEEFRLRAAYDSLSIDGRPVSLLAAKMMLMDGIIPAETRVSDYEALRNLDRAWIFVRKEAGSGIPLTEEQIKAIHRRIVPTAGGRYREHSVCLRGSSYLPPPAEAVAPAMKSLAARMAVDAFSTPLEKAAWLHGEFSKLQPFSSGNGLTARLMMNYTLLEKGYPPISIKPAQKEGYFSALEAYVTGADARPLLQLLKACLDGRLDEFISMYGRSC